MLDNSGELGYVTEILECSNKINAITNNLYPAKKVVKRVTRGTGQPGDVAPICVLGDEARGPEKISQPIQRQIAQTHKYVVQVEVHANVHSKKFILIHKFLMNIQIQ